MGGDVKRSSGKIAGYGGIPFVPRKVVVDV